MLPASLSLVWPGLAGRLLTGLLIGSGAGMAGPGSVSRAVDPPRTTIRVVTDEGTVLGRPLFSGERALILLRRDGRLLEYDVRQIRSAEEVSSRFVPHSSRKTQEHLRKIFGSSYEVTRTAHYVIVHPRGLRHQWADPFETMYHRFWHYFSVRGYTIQPPEFPLVVVVFGSQAEFNRVARRDGMSNPGGFAGYYSPTSNWVVTRHDTNAVTGNRTLIHEALHQFAFNTGIQQRWAATPLWCAEGLATMFEAPGVHDGRRHSRARDRLNPALAEVLRQRIADPAGADMLESLVESDHLFERDPEFGYALSWGLVWYLAETRPAQLNAYLQKIARRPRGEPYAAADRKAEFRQAFGIDFVMLHSHFVRYLAEAPR